MLRKTAVVCLVFLAIFPVAVLSTPLDDPNPDVPNLRKKPITTAGGQVGALLKQWWQQGTAAGNAGDCYDNRDGDHSPLNLAPWPQMSAVKYSPAEIKARQALGRSKRHRALCDLRQLVHVGPRSSGRQQSAPLLRFRVGLSFLYDEFTKNNLYIYPEHRDHDPGHNGLLHPPPFGRGSGAEGGHGDLYPTNTPYLIISQGSSGSDQPFMRMMPVMLAAFRPEVKQKLVATGTLMPTIQMLFRSSNKQLKDAREYITGKAHPTVFEGSWVDELAMVRKAHALELKSLPPMVQLRVSEHDKATNGVDFCDVFPSEVIGYTPACIARIHRGKAYRQHIVVDAGASYDLNKNKLTYTWVILRGDPAKIKITPKKDDQSAVEITVAYHERRPIAPGSPLESNRVDIGCFVHNGTHYSAPGFVTFFTLDREARTYNDRGVPLEIAHGVGEADVRVKDWDKILEAICDEPATALFQVAKDHAECLGEVVVERKLIRLLNTVNLERQKKKAEAAAAAAKTVADKERAKKNLVEIRKEANAQRDKLDALLHTKKTALKGSARDYFESRFVKLVQDPLFTVTHRDWLKKQRKPANEARIKSLWQKLVNNGIAQPNETLTPLLPGKTLADAKWTRFERSQLEWLNASLLAELAFPGMLQVSYQTNYVDQRLSAPRDWRDVYRYDPKGEFIGWTRYSAAGVQAFNHEGLLAVERDPQGRCVKGRVVSYARDPITGPATINNPLRMVTSDTIVRYEFSGADDWRGKRASVEKK